MTHQKINFQRQRDLGEIISDTFKFVRQNYKSLLGFIFRITGPVFLILLFALGYYSYLGMDLLGEGSIFSNPDVFDSATYIISLFVLLAALLAFYVLLNATVLHFIKSYVNNDGVVIAEEVYQGVKSDFAGMLGLLILAGIMAGAGLMMCILPGIYLWVPLSVAPAILVLRQESLIDAISEGFNLIRNNWWMTFFSLFVMTLLVYLIGMIFQFPMLIYFFFKAIIVAQEGSAADPASLFDWVYVVFNVISSLFQYLLSTIIVIATAFIYYNLDEKKNFTGSYQTISSLGSETS